MRIVDADFGLFGFLGISGSMSRLQDLVVIAGPNGGGKSRILTAISNLAGNERPERPGSDIERSQLQGLANLDQYANPAARESQAQASIQGIQRSSGFLIEGPFVASRPIQYTPDGSLLRSHRDNAFGETHGALVTLTSLGPGHVGGKALSYIYGLHHRVMAERHRQAEGGAASAEMPRFQAELDEMQALLQALIGTRSEVTPEGDVRLFGMPAPNGLSPGQCVLVKLAVMLHAQASGIEKVILLLDEPENHLHPSVLIDVLTRIRKACTNGQVWVATHSLPLIASVPLESVWYVEGGKPTWAGRRPETVIAGLVGSGQNSRRIQEFMALPAQFALSNFAAECLVPPGVAPARLNDPQVKQLRQLIFSAIKDGRPLRVLDYGAGQGRLLSGLVEELGADRVRSMVDYVAYEEDGEFRSLRERSLKEVYGELDARRLLDDETALRSRTNENSFDLVVLCNVLHEVESTQWVGLLARTLAGRLKDDGNLLVAELTEFQVGELAHSAGFHVLDQDLLRHLFALDESELLVSVDEKRFTATVVPSKYLSRASSDTVTKTLRALRDQAVAKIAKLRRPRGDGSYSDGLAHAFWAMQLANAELALNGTADLGRPARIGGSS